MWGATSYSRLPRPEARDTLGIEVDLCSQHRGQYDTLNIKKNVGLLSTDSQGQISRDIFLPKRTSGILEQNLPWARSESCIESAPRGCSNGRASGLLNALLDSEENVKASRNAGTKVVEPDEVVTSSVARKKSTRDGAGAEQSRKHGCSSPDVRSVEANGVLRWASRSQADNVVQRVTEITAVSERGSVEGVVNASQVHKKLQNSLEKRSVSGRWNVGTGEPRSRIELPEKSGPEHLHRSVSARRTGCGESGSHLDSLRSTSGRWSLKGENRWVRDQGSIIPADGVDYTEIVQTETRPVLEQEANQVPGLLRFEPQRDESNSTRTNRMKKISWFTKSSDQAKSESTWRPQATVLNSAVSNIGMVENTTSPNAGNVSRAVQRSLSMREFSRSWNSRNDSAYENCIVTPDSPASETRRQSRKQSSNQNNIEQSRPKVQQYERSNWTCSGPPEIKPEAEYDLESNPTAESLGKYSFISENQFHSRRFGTSKLKDVQPTFRDLSSQSGRYSDKPWSSSAHKSFTGKSKHPAVQCATCGRGAFALMLQHVSEPDKRNQSSTNQICFCNACHQAQSSPALQFDFRGQCTNLVFENSVDCYHTYHQASRMKHRKGFFHYCRKAFGIN